MNQNLYTDSAVELIDNNIDTEQEKLIDKYGNVENTENIGRIEMEVIEAEEKTIGNDNYLYPHTSDPNFSLKIANKKEFSNTGYNYVESKTEEEFKKNADELMSGGFILSPHQIFVRNFLSSSTPYNSLLLFHGLGSGKTLSSIGISEQYRREMRQTSNFKSIMVVASPNVQQNFKLQLFDERKLDLIDGLWTYDGNKDNAFIRQINPMGIKGITKEKMISQIKSIIRSSYTFVGYRKFAKLIEDIETKSTINDKIKKNIFKNIIETEFNDRLIIIDEIHNIKKTEGNDESSRRVSKNLLKVIKNSNNMRLLLLSATPMYNDYKEIIFMLNMMNLNDGRDELYLKDVFTKDGSFITGEKDGKNNLIRKSRGYISFVRGENPYTFPYRIFPSLFENDKSILNKNYPLNQINGSPMKNNKKIQFIDLYTTNMGVYQKKGYNLLKSKLIKKIKDIVDETDETNTMTQYGYTTMQPLIESLNIVYPHIDVEDETMSTQFIGSTGLNYIMNHEESIEKRYKTNYQYKDEILKKYGRIFSYDNIGNYSGKIKNILDKIITSEGVSIIYSQYIDGGVLPIALALEEMGYKRYGNTKSLFSEEHIKQHKIIPIDYQHNVKTNIKENEFKQASYAMITGDMLLSPDNSQELMAATENSNIYGSKIKVIFITRAGSEGLDFKFVRNVFVLDPWYNISRIEQIIGRAIRFKSHKDLPFEKRNTSIYLYCTYDNENENDEETADLYIYRNAEIKAIKIGNVTRALKEASVDCVLNNEQNKFTSDNINLTVTQQVSNGNNVQYEIGDKPFSNNCDYMENCIYKCSNRDNNLKLDIDDTTFNQSFAEVNMEIIITIIKSLFEDNYIYDKIELYDNIKKHRQFLNEEIDFAIDKMINNQDFVYDSFGKLGYIVNVGPYYLYQPKELEDKSIDVFERITPVDYKQPKIRLNINFGQFNNKNKENIEYNREEAYNTMEKIMEHYKKIIIDNDKETDEYFGINILRDNVRILNELFIKELVFDYLFDRCHIMEKIYLLNQCYDKINNENINKNIQDGINTLEEEFLTLGLKCMEKYKFNFDNTVYYVFEDESDYSVVVKDKYWIIDNTLKDYIKNSIMKTKYIGPDVFSNEFMDEYIGFMLFSKVSKSSKDSKIEFKMKYMKNQRSKSFVGNDYLKKYKIDMINNYLFPERNTIIPDKVKRNENFYNFSNKDNKFRVLSLTNLIEIMYRYYDKLKHQDKRWFMDPLETIIVKKEKTIIL